jgi:tetratricopeptide (TPR) repeat protein
MGSVPFVTYMHRATQASVTPKPPVSSPLLLRQLHKCSKAFGRQSRRCCNRTASQARASTAQQAPASAKVAVEQGLEAFANGDTTKALSLFRKGLSMNPSQDEARAALYNSACCFVKEKKWQAAADAVSDACNNYGLKYVVALKVNECPSASSCVHKTLVLKVHKQPYQLQDPDLRQLRERREWLDATENIKGAVSKASLVELRSEAKAPFRLIRMFLTLGAGAAAVVSLGITLYALKGVLQGQSVQRLRHNLPHVQSALAVFSTRI